MRTRSLLLPALAGVSLLSLSLTSLVTRASAQVPPSNNVTVEFQNTDVRQALRDLFKTSGRSFTIDPAVQGTVTASMKNVAFDTALQNVAFQADATYRVEGGVYAIVPRTEPPTPAPGGFGGGQGGGFGGGGVQNAPFATPEPPVMVVDGPDLFVLRRGMVYKIDKRDMKIVGQLAVGPVGPGGRPGGGFGGGPGGGRGAGGGLGGGQP